MTLPEERRLVTVLFVDMVGFTSRADAADPEEIRTVQRAYFEAVSGQVERFGGRVEKYIGDAVMAIYGAPRAHDDDAERAVHAALAIRDDVRGDGDGLEVRIGVNTGEVVGGAGAGPQAAEYTVTGDAVNVAARLQQAAEPGEILVGATTRRLAAEAFDFAAVAALELKGKAEPVEAWRVVRALPQRPRVRGGETPLVGRGRELRLLEAALEDAAADRGVLVGIAGEAGLGKSRLALEVRARADRLGFASTWATALSYAGSFPYHLVAQLVEQMVERRDGGDRTEDALRVLLPDVKGETIERWAASLADVLGGGDRDAEAAIADLTPSARQRLVVQALQAIVVARAEQRQQLIVLDDLHWADASSLAVLDDVLGIVPDRRIVVLALYRPGWVNPWATRSFYQQVNLDRLRSGEAQELLRALSPRAPVAADEAKQLLHRSGGNPFFLEELLRSGAAGMPGGSQLPETIHELLLARLDALPPEGRAALQVAAVVGMEFSERLVAAVEPMPDLERSLAMLQAEDLIVPHGGDVEDRTFGMRHPLVHEVAYRSLLVARRRVLHRRIGEWLEQHRGEEALAEIAAHYRAGDDLDRAREYVPRAAERAARLNALREALGWYLKAAELFVDDPGHRAQMLERAATQSYLLGDMKRAIELVSEAIGLYEAAGDRLHALDCRRWRGRYYWMDGRGRQAEDEIVAAIKGLEQMPPSPQLALAYSYRSQLRMLMPDYPTGEQLARRAIELAERAGSVEALAHAYCNLGMCLVGQGDPAGVDAMRRSLALSIEHNLVDDASRAYTNLSGQGAEVNLFAHDEAEALYDEMIAFDREHAPGGVYEQWHLAGRAELWISVGRWDEAERQLAELAEIRGANRYVRVDIGAFRALVAAYRGRYDEALTVLEPHVEAAIEINDLQAYAPTLIALAHTRRGLGEARSAVDAIERGLVLRGETREANISSWYLFEGADLATWLAANGRAGGDGPDETVRLVALLHGLAVRMENDVARGGTEPELLVRRALYGAGTTAVRALAASSDATPAAVARRVDAPDVEPLLRAAADLDRADRIFDAARVRLWVAELGRADVAAVDAARSVFARLRAGPYLGRLARIG